MAIKTEKHNTSKLYEHGVSEYHQRQLRGESEGARFFNAVANDVTDIGKMCTYTGEFQQNLQECDMG